jgi:hypothetical protein
MQGVRQAIRKTRCREFIELEGSHARVASQGHEFVELEGGKGCRQAVGPEFVEQAVCRALCREFVDSGRSRACREFVRPFARLWGREFVELKGASHWILSR